jgi:ABC-type polysaccharide/polyol phosphate transport system ATPase subunit
MSQEEVITFDNVGLCYPMQRGLFGGHVKHLLGMTSDKDYWALRNVSFSIRSGGILGVIGENGAGKTTMGRVVAGVYSPDEGTISVRGRATMLSIGTGFVKELSGRENILVNGAYLGFNSREMRARSDEIIEFADIGHFIDQPIKTYSRGMRSRLGFAIAMSLQPEILIIDEILSAGDAAFRKKSTAKLNEMVSSAKAVIVIAHQMGFLKSICTELLWLHKGRVQMQGKPKKVIRAYQDSEGLNATERADDDAD